MPNVYSFKTCIHCGVVKRGNGHKYCSKKCQMDFQHKLYIEEWLSGKRDGMRGVSETSLHIKRHLTELQNNKCSFCKNSMWMGKKISLSLHHVDGNFRNNVIKNLTLLCPNCHSQTPNYGRKNTGNGRPRYFLKEK